MYVVNVTDTVLSQLMENCNIIAENNVIRKVFFGVSKVLALKQPDFLKELCNHNANTDEISSHKTRMIEKIFFKISFDIEILAIFQVSQ